MDLESPALIIFVAEMVSGWTIKTNGRMKFSYTFPELKKWIEGSKHDKVSRVSTFASLVELMRQPRCCMKAEASKVVTTNITGKHTTNVHPASD